MKAKNHHLMKWAHLQVSNARNSGKLNWPDVCSGCGASSSANGFRMHAHHDDYAKPFDVRWLCPACHKTVHMFDESEWPARFKSQKMEYDRRLITWEDFSPEQQRWLREMFREDLLLEVEKLVVEKQKEIVALTQYSSRLRRLMRRDAIESGEVKPVKARKRKTQS